MVAILYIFIDIVIAILLVVILFLLVGALIVLGLLIAMLFEHICMVIDQNLRRYPIYVDIKWFLLDYWDLGLSGILILLCIAIMACVLIGNFS